MEHGLASGTLDDCLVTLDIHVTTIAFWKARHLCLKCREVAARFPSGALFRTRGSCIRFGHSFSPFYFSSSLSCLFSLFCMQGTTIVTRDSYFFMTRWFRVKNARSFIWIPRSVPTDRSVYRYIDCVLHDLDILFELHHRNKFQGIIMQGHRTPS